MQNLARITLLCYPFIEDADIASEIQLFQTSLRLFDKSMTTDEC